MANREEQLSRLTGETWDVVVIGGGATGLGAAVDAASRGYRTVLIEQSDFAKATSSRSTKLIHGGVRYLKQGNISLVRESLHERGLLLKNAPGLVRPLEFVIPTYSLAETLFYAAGLKAYDLLAGRLGMAGSQMLSTAEVLKRLPTLRSEKLRGGVSYYDAQFDDARLALAMSTALAKKGGIPLNYVRASGLLRKNGKLSGVVGEDVETGRQYEIAARAVINATGIFTDELRRMDDAHARPMLRVSQGTHIVVDQSFLPRGSAIILPSTDDGRVLFLIPWHGAVVIGTTDVPMPEPVLDPIPQASEIDFLLKHASRYLSREVTRADVRSCFSGLRPLVSSGEQSATSKLSRDHVVKVSASGLVTITGGKWTTYRRMAKDAVDAAVAESGLLSRPSETESLTLWGNPHDTPLEPQTAASVTTQFIQNAVRNESARTVEDVLSRRCRLLLLDARAALSVAPQVAHIMARELGRDAAWESAQVELFRTIASTYLLS
ncbi:glycerol-3-phosphate dehydrogenase/oxidase [Planctomicrobium piriforme]|uniref:Glycerol-3-phosphate dehydrogenase n=1 Tax=Planctomicrobium piriforme TaxID=1576369 RepID=A0A1I3F5E8_9PLAN|nr:glycerol-3-phosphate dehydrogenase/oxidase [Planctomicrobium piriforme]SFI06360.1 glycerol-3-phosphate dehydrogenase [Planctomicrobium piriforme]